MNDSIIFNCIVNVENALFHISLDKSFFELVTRPVSIHNHAAYEVHIIKSGRYVFHIDRQEIIMESGNCLIIGPNTYHSKGNALSENSRRYSFRFEYSYKNGDVSDTIKYMGIVNRYCLLENSTKEISFVETLVKEFQNKHFGYMTAINNLFSQLILTIIRNISVQGLNTKNSFRGDNNFKSIQFKDIGGNGTLGDSASSNKFQRDNALGDSAFNSISLEESVEENRTVVIDEFFAFCYMNNVHIHDLAKLLNLSIRQLNRIMLKYYGVTFKQKLAQMRAYAAKELLSGSDLTIIRIAEKTGYNNISYFISAFKKVTGMTPEQFRKSAKRLI